MQIFGPADKALNRGSRYNIRICEVGVAFPHPSRHITVCGRNGDLTALWSAWAGIDTGSTSGFLDNLDSSVQQSFVKPSPPSLLAYAFGTTLDKCRNADAPPRRHACIHGDRRDIP